MQNPTPTRTRSTVRTAALVAVAALGLATAANTASYAAGGPSVGLGRANHSAHTTSISSTHGPALSLRSRPSSPSLAVSSTKQVARLNASMVGGKTAAALEPTTKVYSLGTAAGPLPSYTTDQLTVPPGLYRVGVTVIHSGGSAINCYAFPYEAVFGGDYTNLIGGQADFIMSFNGIVKMSAGQHLAVGCEGSGALQAPARVTVQKLSGAATAAFPTRSAPKAGRHLHIGQ